jgi:protein-S-isoprenylcysteine O-methyltransferase Ste14
MKSLTLWQLELLPWYVFIFYWVVSSLRVKQTKTEQNSWERMAHLAAMGVAVILLFTRAWRIGALGWRFVPEGAWPQETGIFLTSVGVAVAVWARHSLGEHWSARVTLKVDHQLICSGPYAYIRHPIYTGLLVAASGTALAVGEWRAVVGVVLALAAFSHKALKEEALLASEFGDRYQKYRSHTGFLIPRFR